MGTYKHKYILHACVTIVYMNIIIVDFNVINLQQINIKALNIYKKVKKLKL